MDEEIREGQQGETGAEGQDAAGSAMTFDQWLDSDPAWRSEFDRRMTKGVQTARSRWEQEQADSQDEARKLERMTAAQRERYQLEKDRAALAAQQAEFSRQQLQVQVGQSLQKEGLSADFARFLTGKDAEESAANLAAFQELWNESISSAVTSRMRGGEPPREPKAQTAVSREALKSMTPAQIMEAYEKGELNDILKGRK